MFEHVDVDGAARHGQPARVSAAAPAPSSSSSSPPAGAAGGRSPLVSQGSLGSVQGSPRSASGVLAEHGPANAALKLLDNLCMMLTGRAHALLCVPGRALSSVPLCACAGVSVLHRQDFEGALETLTFAGAHHNGGTHTPIIGLPQGWLTNTRRVSVQVCLHSARQVLPWHTQVPTPDLLLHGPAREMGACAADTGGVGSWTSIVAHHALCW